MSEGLPYKTPIPVENFHHFAYLTLAAQINDQKGHFHPCVQGSMFVLHSSHVYQELERWPTVPKYHAVRTFKM